MSLRYLMSHLCLMSLKYLSYLMYLKNQMCLNYPMSLMILKYLSYLKYH